MADEDLRARERRHDVSGTPADEAAWLTARVRAGALAPERLALAVRLGHEAARLVAGGDAPPIGLLDLVRHEQAEVRLRTWLAIGWSVLVVHHDARVALQLKDLEAGLIAGTPSPERTFTLEATAGAEALAPGQRLASHALFELRPELRPPTVAERLRRRGITVEPETLAEMAARMDPVSGPPTDEEALLALAAVERCMPGADALLRSVRAELVAWLLDVDDPVRLRVASA